MPGGFRKPAGQLPSHAGQQAVETSLQSTSPVAEPEAAPAASSAHPPAPDVVSPRPAELAIDGTDRAKPPRRVAYDPRATRWARPEVEHRSPPPPVRQQHRQRPGPTHRQRCSLQLAALLWTALQAVPAPPAGSASAAAAAASAAAAAPAAAAAGPVGVAPPPPRDVAEVCPSPPASK